MPTAAAVHRVRSVIELPPAQALLWTVLALVAAIAAVALFDPNLAPTEGVPLAAHALLINAVPVALLALALLALTGRALTSGLLATAAYAALVTASAIKLDQLGLPLLPADFGFLGLSGGGSLFRHYVEALQLAWIALFVLAALLAARRETRRWRPAVATRIVLALLACVGATTLWRGTAGWRAFYDGWNTGFEPWSPADSVKRLGITANLLVFHWELVRPDRAPPDHDRVLEFIAEHAQAFARSAEADAAGELPDIIVVQSESFFDPARLTGVDAGDSLPNFRRLSVQGTSGELRVPTYAGGTIRTEFEVLSGVPLAAFPGVEYPYFELVDAPMPGLMRTLADHGYRTSVIHPNDAAFWNRRDALAHLGAQRFLALPAFARAPKEGLFIADAALTDRLVAELDDEGPPQFLFAISMEAHGPYEVSPGLDAERLAAIALPAALDEYGARTLRHFLYHLANADHELGRLAALVQQRTRPTVLLFYGDHLPGLHSTFAQLGFADGRAPREQPVPFLIIDNRRDVARTENTRSWMLPALLLETAGVTPDAYLALVAALRHDPAAFIAADGVSPEPRFAELARLRVRDEFDAGEFASALAPTVETAPTAVGDSLLPEVAGDDDEPAAN